MINRVAQRHELGAAVLFTELVTLEWEGGTILMRGRSGGYVAHGHMSVEFATELYTRLGKLLTETGIVQPLKCKKRKRKKRKR